MKTGKRWILVPFVALLLLSGCATTRGEKGLADSGKGDKALIKAIRLEEGDERDTIRIEGSRPIAYTAFKLTDPPRLIIDVPDFELADIQSPIGIWNDRLTKIEARRYEEGPLKVARLEIGLREESRYEISLQDNSLLVEVEGGGSNHVAKLDVEEEARPEEVSSPPETREGETGAAEKETPPQEIKEAKTILSIDHSRGEGYEIVRMKGDGLIGNYNIFTLDEPNRIVFDLWKVKTELEKRAIPVQSSLIKDIRIGQDPFKLRVVLDMKDGIPPYRVEKRGKDVYLLLGDVDKALASIPSAPVVRAVKKERPVEERAERVREVEEVKRPEKKNSVESVDFTEGKASSLIIVKTSMPADYRLSRSPDGRSITLLLKGALLREDLKRTIDTSALGVGIESFSSFPSPKDPRDTIILVKLEKEILPKIKKVDNAIVMEFPKPLKVVVKKKKVTPEVKEKKEETRKQEKASSEEGPAYTGKKISLDVKDADITNIFRLLAEVSKLNIVVPEEVKGKITLRLIDVPWDQALDIILKTKGLGMIREGNVIRIAPVQKIAEEKKRLLEEKKAAVELEELTVKLIPVNYAKASEISPKVKGLLSPRGSVTVDDRTNTLVIKDVADNIKEAEALIKKLDTPTPQVLIEARIVEASRTFARDLGIEWGVDMARGTDKIRQSALFGGLSASGLTAPSNLGLNSNMGTSNFAVSLPASGGAGTLGAVGFMFGKFTNNPVLLDLRLSAGEVDGLSKTISRPKIITLDNKEAKISQGKTIPYQTVSESGTQTQFIDATLDLTVTPHVTPDGRILLKIKVSKNSKGEDTAAGPVILKKEASTEILLQDMETAVIGGIVETEKSDSVSGVPGVKDIPGLGWLFKKKSKSDTQTELLIFITPKILKESSS